MPDLRAAQLAAVGCWARPEALDALPPLDALSFRVAPDELLLLGDAGEELVERAQRALRDGIVLDCTDAYAAWTLAGEDVEEAFRRVSAIRIDRPQLQGLVAQVPAKVVALEADLLVLVPSTLGHHLRERVLQACADLGVRELEPAPLRAKAVA